MKKTWLYSTVAGIALLATACANNAAPNNNVPNRTNVQNFAGPRTMTNNMAGAPDGMFNGTMRNYNAFNGANIRTADQTGIRGTGNASIYRDNGRAGIMQNGMSQMGYVRVNRSFLTNNANPLNNVFVDRDALARVVGNVTASCPGVDASTVLVTDEECFVGLNLDRNNAQPGGPIGGMGTRPGVPTNIQSVKAQARMNAMSVCPRYYKVYVTDNQQIIDEMTRIASRSTNMGANQPFDDRMVDMLIRNMGDLPDGQDLTTRGSTLTTEMHRSHKAGIKGTSR
ncbi:YhcN/YlaJ family sporulation lipoprotein [Brevibacillus sp. H7]|uniref:YhcN/YlaJ family sporulation lipoprotein n=1 Tax=Brevibacillus sp. H7 TaxID=3349138 RepID=UPI00381F5BDF